MLGNLSYSTIQGFQNSFAKSQMGSPGLDLCWCHQFGSPGGSGISPQSNGWFFVTQPCLNMASARTAIPPSVLESRRSLVATTKGVPMIKICDHLGVRTWHPRWCWFSSSQLGTQIFRPEPIKNLGTQRIEVHFWCRNANFWCPFSGYLAGFFWLHRCDFCWDSDHKKNAFFIQFEWGEKQATSSHLRGVLVGPNETLLVHIPL